MITSKGFYNFNGKSNRRYIESHKIKGVIKSSKSCELIIHIPTEYDYHYVVSDNLDKLIYYLFLSKQLNSRQPVELVVATVVGLSYKGCRISVQLRGQGETEDRRRVQEAGRRQSR